MNATKQITAERIRLLLQKNKMSQVQLAEKSELSKGTISKAVVEGALSINSAIRIATALGVSLDYLYGNSEIESVPEYALSLIEQHIGSFAKKVSGVYDGVVKGISLSPAFAEYIERSYKMKAIEFPEDFLNEALCKERERFLREIDGTAPEKRDYILIDARLYTVDLEREIAKAENEIKIVK